MARRKSQARGLAGEMDILRALGWTVLPPGGGWVCVAGNPLAPRGYRLPQSHLDLGIRHMDILWGWKEEPGLEIPAPLHLGYKGGATWVEVVENEGLEEAKRIYKEIVFGAPWGAPNLQATLVTVAHPYVEAVRYYSGELRLFSDELIDALLAEEQVQVIPFAIEWTNPIVEEELRDILGSLQVDGLTYHQAVREVLQAGVAKGKEVEALEKSNIPRWFYRPTGAFREQFVEEDVIR